MVYQNRLGQATTTTTTVYRTGVRYPGMYMPYAAMPYGYATRPLPREGTVDPAEVEKAIYKDVTNVKDEQVAAGGTDPQKVLKLRSGLEVPQYILQRDIERKKVAAANKEAAESRPPELPPLFYKIGMFASQKPGLAALAAGLLGVFAGNLYSGK